MAREMVVMIYGNINKCPKCGDHVLQRRLRSFNDFGAMGWSDGDNSIWGLNAISQLGKCPWCQSVFWLDDAENIGILPRRSRPINWFMRLILRLTGDKYRELERERKWQEAPEEWKSAKHVDYPTVDDCWTALENTNTLTPAREMLVRLQYLNPASFAPNALGTFGNLGRNTVRGPGQFIFDLAL